MVKEVPKLIEEVENEVSKVVVGQKRTVRSIMRAILCNGHVLVEGVPGIAKTLVVRAVARVLGCNMNRVQFTVDLLPTDLTGIQTYTPEKGFETLKGPIFANFILADEVNRAPPKTQSALLEAMQEKSVTIAKETFKLKEPFFVMATENPIESSGVYNLPEAQVDRFIFKIVMGYPSFEEEVNIMDQNITIHHFHEFKLREILDADKILSLQELTKKVFSSDAIKEYIVNLVEETRNKNAEYSRFIEYGASPRASIALYIASKAEALMNGRDHVIPDDVKEVVFDVLRHRIILSYEAQAEKINSDKIIEEILKTVNAP